LLLVVDFQHLLNIWLLLAGVELLTEEEPGEQEDY
jgi:hypothetical protein